MIDAKDSCHDRRTQHWHDTIRSTLHCGCTHECCFHRTQKTGKAGLQNCIGEGNSEMFVIVVVVVVVVVAVVAVVVVLLLLLLLLLLSKRRWRNSPKAW